MFQNIYTLEGVSTSLVRDNKNVSLSRLFKNLRKRKTLSIYGDYILLDFILKEVYQNVGKKWTRNQFYNVLDYCKFWEEEERKTRYIPSEWEVFVK
jgi:hypothetical protein